MIKKILKADNFGVLDKFRWNDDLKEFNKLNIIYGWNYSGKTTLSRALRCFELSCKHMDYKRAEVKIKTEDGAEYDCNSFGCGFPVRVFNNDFINANIKWDESLEPIFLIGEENIELQDELKAKQKEKDSLQDEIQKYILSIQNIDEALNSKLTEKAREIKRTLSIPDYDKRKFESAIRTLDPKFTNLNEEKIKQHLKTYQSTNRRASIGQLISPELDQESLHQSVSELLNRIVTSQAIERLKDNPKLNDWVRRGKDLHENKETCQFCGNALPGKLIDVLNKHFSDEYENHIRDIDKKISKLESDRLDLNLPDDNLFYSKYTAVYAVLEKEARRIEYSYNSQIDKYIKLLKQKKESPFKAVSLEDYTEIDGLSVLIEKINVIIQAHNKITEGFEKEKQKALNILQNQYAKEFIDENKYFDLKRQISDLEKKHKADQEKLKKLQVEYNSIKYNLSKTVRGADKINQYLKQFFGRQDIEVSVTEENKFELKRSGSTAKNLSEGEKTAISFAYFITKLEENELNLSKTVIYVDDPISSMDSNHLFHVYSFIKNKLSDSHQLFISTHNFEFYNLVKDWFKRDREIKKKTAFYLIERCSNGDSFVCKLKNIPKELLSFNSEYHYLFSILHEFDRSDTADHEKLYIMPNIARRYLDAFLGFKVPISKGLHGKLEYFISDDVDRDRVYKLINHYSHNDTLMRSLEFPDMAECKEVISIILERVASIDKDHYDTLVAEIA